MSETVTTSAPAALVTLMEMVAVGRIRRKRTYRLRLTAWATPQADGQHCVENAIVTAQLPSGPLQARCVASSLRSPYDAHLWQLYVPASRPALSNKEIKSLVQFLWRRTGAHARKA